MTIEELKVHAYDTLAQIQYLQHRLSELNHSIEEKSKEANESKSKKDVQ